MLLSPDLLSDSDSSSSSSENVNYADIAVTAASECASLATHRWPAQPLTRCVHAPCAVVGVTATVFLVERVGRTGVQAWMYGLCGLVMLPMAALVQYKGPQGVLLLFAMIGRACVMGGSATSWLYPAEAYPTSVRSTGHSAANAAARVGAFVAPFISSLDVVSLWLPTIAFAAASLAASVANMRLKVRTPARGEQQCGCCPARDTSCRRKRALWTCLRT